MLIQNGMAATPEGMRYADIRIGGGTILSVEEHLIPEAGEEVIDASGKWVLPGGIDAHTHFDMPFGDGETTADSFLTGTRAAIAGGTTTVLDFAEAAPDQTMGDSLKIWHDKADGKSYCDYGFHMTVSAWNADCLDDYQQMADAGITSFKAYTAYQDSLGVDDETMARIIRRVKEVGGLLMVHCENGGLLNVLQEELAAVEKARVRNHADSRPAVVEAEAISRVMDIAALREAPVYIVHISTGEGMRRIIERQKNGQAVFAETCPHYLLFDASKYDSNDLTAAGYVMSPPLRAPEDEETIWKALKDGYVNTVSTDHCTFNLKGQKDRGLDDFRNLPGGVPGVENRMELMFHYGIGRGISVMDLVRVTAENPARIFGLYPKKGVLAVGSDADIVIMNPFSPHTYTAADQVTDLDYTIYEGIRVRKKVEEVIRRGKRIYSRGTFLEDQPGGVFVPSGKALQTGL